MTEPKRILTRGDADDLGRRLLESALSDRPRRGAHGRVLGVLGLGVGATCTAATAAAGTAGKAAGLVSAGSAAGAKVGASAAGSTIAGASSAGAAVLAKWAVIGVVAGAAAVGTAETAPSMIEALGPEPVVRPAREPSRPSSTTPEEVAGPHVQDAGIEGRDVRELRDVRDASDVQHEQKAAAAEAGILSGAVEPEELRLLDECREALRTGDASAAARTMESYRARFPGGALAEEADALRIEALWKSGSVREAGASFDVFRDKYPDSPLRERLQAMVRPTPPATTQVRPEDPFESRY